MSDTPETDPSPPQSGSAPDRERAAPPGDPDPEGPVDEPAAREEPSGPTEPGQAGTAAGTPQRTKLLLEAAAGALVLALVAGGVAGGRVLGWWGGAADPAAAPTSAPTPAESSMASPFAGTPAEHFAEGEAGIVLPAAEAVGDFTAEEVAEALEQVRQALIAARLDETMLVDHNPEKFLSLLAPDHQVGRRLEFDTGEFASYATQIAPGVELAPVSPRVYGTVAYEATTVEGGLPALAVATVSTWAYAFAQREATDANLMVIHDQARWELRLDSRWLESSQGLWLADARAVVRGGGCDSQGQLELGGEPGQPDMSWLFEVERPLEPGLRC